MTKECSQDNLPYYMSTSEAQDGLPCLVFSFNTAPTGLNWIDNYTGGGGGGYPELQVS